MIRRPIEGSEYAEPSRLLQQLKVGSGHARISIAVGKYVGKGR